MENQPLAVLLDTISIQRYIFSTNNLKENIGSSQIVEEIYDIHLKDVIKEIFSLTDDDYYNAWRKQSERIAILEDLSPFEIGYIGGGNVLLFFRNEKDAIEFIKRWSMRLLIHSSGLVPACVLGKIDFNDFSNSLKKLFKNLSENKSRFIPETVIRRHGITAECPRTGYSAEIWCDRLPEKEQNYISSVSYAKIMAAERADKKLESLLKYCGLDSYRFTDKLDELGQSKGEESHIAIVHIDGNDMGRRFQVTNNLKDLRELSWTVKEAVLNSFKTMLRKIHENIDEIKKEGIKLKVEEGKTVLPLRPIIIGGDDITFVSEGRLGIWLATVFLEEFAKQKVSDNKSLSACAGIAITKTKYPFYRGYKLSEDLTRSAKEARKIEKDNGSWIDFHIAYGGFSGELEKIRSDHYRNPDGYSLLLRPYKIEDFNKLLEGVWELKKKVNGKPKYPRSKLMELKEVLYLSRVKQDLFMEEFKARGLRLPEYKNFSGREIVINTKTPYFDMIEIMEFYPEFALPGRKG